jgi:hypothetical protein
MRGTKRGNTNAGIRVGPSKAVPRVKRWQGLKDVMIYFLYNRSRKRWMERRGIRRGGERKTGTGY